MVRAPTIPKEEVEHAISKMKLGKATWPDDIPVKKITALDDLGITKTTNLMNAIYSTRKILVDMKSIFITLHKPRILNVNNID